MIKNYITWAHFDDQKHKATDRGGAIGSVLPDSTVRFTRFVAKPPISAERLEEVTGKIVRAGT